MHRRPIGNAHRIGKRRAFGTGRVRYRRAIGTGRVITAALLAAGATAGPAFVIIYTACGARREHYRARRHPVSSLSLGPGGWVQVANFWAAAALYGLGALGLTRVPRRSLTPALAGLAAGCLAGSAAFTPDPINGYPPGTPDAGQPTPAGLAHNLATVPMMIGLPAVAVPEAIRLFRRGHVGAGAYSAATAAVGSATVVLAGAGFAQVPRLSGTAGWLQRVYITAGLGWLTVGFVRAVRDALA